jgi:hypothetical protein
MHKALAAIFEPFQETLRARFPRYALGLEADGVLERRWPGELIRQFTHPLALLLWLAATLLLMVGSLPSTWQRNAASPGDQP